MRESNALAYVISDPLGCSLAHMDHFLLAAIFGALQHLQHKFFLQQGDQVCGPISRGGCLVLMEIDQARTKRASDRHQREILHHQLSKCVKEPVTLPQR